MDQVGSWRMPAVRSECGAALVLVLWVGAVLSLVLTGFAFSMRVEADATRNFRDHAQAIRLAESGITEVLANLANAKPPADGAAAPAWPLQSGPRRMGRGVYQVIVTNEDSKISLNHASETVLKKLLQQTGVSDVPLQETIAAAIVDWRDSDDVERPNGAESEYYLSRAVPHVAKNAPFQRIEELLAVRGMNRDILYGTIQDRARRDLLRTAPPDQREFAAGEYLGIASSVTAHGSGKMDYTMAERDVLFALELPQRRMREILSVREAEGGSGNMTGASGVAKSSPRIYHIESIGRIDQSPIAAHIVAVVAREGTLRAPRFRVLAWHEKEG